VNSSTTPFGFNMSPAKDGAAQMTAAAAAICSKILLFMGVPVPAGMAGTIRCRMLARAPAQEEVTLR
jgi:hypothetical protein